MNWFRRLFMAERPRACTIAELAQVDEYVELRGTTEALRVIHDPVDGSEALMINYTALIRERADSQLGFNDPASISRHSQGASFLLRDGSGVALIEVDGGEDLEAVHAGFLDQYGAGIGVSIETIAPGDAVCVRGRVRALVSEGSPHRSEAWAAVIHSAEIEPRRDTP